ncbi:uncharacterized protein [Physcomitrium patens]|uniref:uncharacterized protein isoform X2 n=1 Tax=Physcomitrium patens TaxID=3218 RepID=UPI003CCE2869
MILYSNLKEFEMCSNPYCVLAAVGCCAAFFVCLSCESALGQNLPGGVNAIRKLCSRGFDGFFSLKTRRAD